MTKPCENADPAIALRPARAARRSTFGILALLAALAIAWPGAASAQDQFGLLGSLEFRTGSIEAIPQWTGVLDRIAAQRAVYAACDRGDCPQPGVQAWRRQVADLASADPLQQLDAINRFANRAMPYLEDIQNYGRSDYWASPLEFFDRSGDCEDFAILKFVSLLELGFTNDQMRIVVVEDVLRRLPHAVLSVQIDGQFYILDSLIDVVLPHERATQYAPQYSVNMTTRWAHIVTPELTERFRAQGGY